MSQYKQYTSMFPLSISTYYKMHKVESKSKIGQSWGHKNRKVVVHKQYLSNPLQINLGPPQLFPAVVLVTLLLGDPANLSCFLKHMDNKRATTHFVWSHLKQMAQGQVKIQAQHYQSKNLIELHVLHMQVTARTHDFKTCITFISNTQQFMPLHSNLSSINLFMYIYICKCILSDINTALQLCMHKVNFVPAHQILFMNLSNKLYLGFFGVLWTQDLQSFTVNLLLRVVIVTEHGVALDSRLVD